MTDRFRIWWTGRSDRERWLVGIMAALVFSMFFWLVVIRPINAARAAAILRLDAAAVDAGQLREAGEAMRLASAGAPLPLTVALSDAVNQAAVTSGLTLARADASAADRVTIAISTAKSPALFAFLAGLERQGLIVDKLSLRTNSDATLAVEGVLRQRGR